jgi:hypothetical protein
MSLCEDEIDYLSDDEDVKIDKIDIIDPFYDETTTDLILGTLTDYTKEMGLLFMTGRDSYMRKCIHQMLFVCNT